MAERTLEELEAEVEAGKKILSEIYENNKYTPQQLLEQSQKVDSLVVEIMRMRSRIDKMIKDYNLRLVEGKIGSDSLLVSENRDDFRFLEKNRSAFLSRLVEIESKNT